MSRLTGSDAYGLMEAYNAVYAPQELTEEQVWEEVEVWVNSLVEEGYDLSEYTWEEMYEVYLNEAIGQPGSAGMVNWKDKNTGAVRSGYKSSSDGKLYRNYNDALAARNSRLRSAQQPGTSVTMNALNARGVQDRFIQDKPARQAPITTPTRPTITPRSSAAPVRQSAPSAASKPTPTATQTSSQSPTLGYQLAQRGTNIGSNILKPRTSAVDDIRAMRQRSQQRIMAQGGTPATPLVQSFDPLEEERSARRRKPKKSPEELKAEIYARDDARTAARAAKGPSGAAATAQEDARKRRNAETYEREKAARGPSYMTRKSAYSFREDNDVYDIILSHILDEGYAETVEAAEVIMVNMSDEWREEILDERADNVIMSVTSPTGKKRSKVRPGGTVDSDSHRHESPEQIANRRFSQQLSDRKKKREAEMAAGRLTVATKRGIEKATNRSNDGRGGNEFAPGSALRRREVGDLPTDYRARRRRASGR